MISLFFCACGFSWFFFFFPFIKTAQMGVGEGKSIGEWFGPNTVAQVLK